MDVREIESLGMLSVILPYQSDLETMTKVAIDDLEGGVWGKVWGNRPFIPRLDTSNICIFQYICKCV